MEKELTIKREYEVQSLSAGIAYSCVEDWYAGTYRNLKMNLLFPKHREDHPAQPALLWICGGGFSVVSRDIWMPELMYYARRGYTVASVEYRTSNMAGFPAPLIDVKTAVRYLKAHAKQYCIDPEYIFVAGESAGGTFASFLGATGNEKSFDVGDYLEFNSKVAGVIDFYGPIDFKNECLLQSEKVPSWCLDAFLGENYTDDTIRFASPVHYIDKNTVPFLIFHGTDDLTVSIKQSDELYEKLQQEKIPVEYYKLRGAQHGDDLFYQDPIKEIVVDFMKRIQLKKENCFR